MNSTQIKKNIEQILNKYISKRHICEKGQIYYVFTWVTSKMFSALGHSDSSEEA